MISMDAIVAVYSDWGIGARGTQPVVLKADRLRFRSETDGAAVIVGRKTLEDFPGGRPLKNRHNIVVTRQNVTIPGTQAAHSVDEALALARPYPRCFVIGGASVFLDFFPHIDRVLVTKIDLAPHSDSFFPDLDREPGWAETEAGEWREEDGLRYRFCEYRRK
ncbi:MAG TPA: dihydrofolate reductase [Oscillospiraceae bacterium]|nr:dihydrofolate reductase [Oscillospiraceae bacterium]